MSSSMAAPSSYWCYLCSRLVLLQPQEAIVCPDCNSGFLEQIDSPPFRFHSRAENHQRHRHRRRHATASSPDAHELGSVGAIAADGSQQHSDLRRRRRHFRTSASGRWPFNPVILLLRNPSRGGTSFELYHDDGTTSGLRPIPETISDHLMRSGFGSLLHHIAQIELAGLGLARRCDNPPASKAAIESMPTVNIAAEHISDEFHCAICMDPFELRTKAREMPCKHIYHQDCILPWLSLHNSCPVCRHEMQAAEDDEPATTAETEEEEEEEETVGLTIWRLPGGGFAVGRFSGGRRAAEQQQQLPAAFSEMDGAFNNRRASMSEPLSATPERGRVRRAVYSFFSFFGLSCS